MSSHLDADVAYLDRLNASQLDAASYDIDNNGFCGPLLIIAGAGTGKTTTLAHRYAHLIISAHTPHNRYSVTSLSCWGTQDVRSPCLGQDSIRDTIA